MLVVRSSSPRAVERLMGGESVRMRCRHCLMLAKVELLSKAYRCLRMAEEENAKKVQQACNQCHGFEVVAVVCCVVVYWKTAHQIIEGLEGPPLATLSRIHAQSGSCNVGHLRKTVREESTRYSTYSNVSFVQFYSSVPIQIHQRHR